MITVEKAVANFLELTQNGWNVELAVECCHDTVYDMISITQFAEKCLRAVEIAKIANINHN